MPAVGKTNGGGVLVGVTEPPGVVVDVGGVLLGEGVVVPGVSLAARVAETVGVAEVASAAIMPLIGTFALSAPLGREPAASTREKSLDAGLPRYGSASAARSAKTRIPRILGRGMIYVPFHMPSPFHAPPLRRPSICPVPLCLLC